MDFQHFENTPASICYVKGGTPSFSTRRDTRLVLFQWVRLNAPPPAAWRGTAAASPLRFQQRLLCQQAVSVNLRLRTCLLQEGHSVLPMIRRFYSYKPLELIKIIIKKKNSHLACGPCMLINSCETRVGIQGNVSQEGPPLIFWVSEGRNIRRLERSER